MPKFKTIYSDGSKAGKVALQTRTNQDKASKEKRLPKWFRRILKRARRFNLPWLTSHRKPRQRKQGRVA